MLLRISVLVSVIKINGKNKLTQQTYLLIKENIKYVCSLIDFKIDCEISQYIFIWSDFWHINFSFLNFPPNPNLERYRLVFFKVYEGTEKMPACNKFYKKSQWRFSSMKCLFCGHGHCIEMLVYFLLINNCLFWSSIKYKNELAIIIWQWLLKFLIWCNKSLY